MRKVIAYISMSLDGYVADKYGGVGWLSGDGSQTESFGSYPEFIETVDTVILGYTTYHQIVTELSPDKWAYEGKQSYVLTNSNCINTEEITFTNQNIVDLISNIKSADGKNVWICGGASIINQFHKQGLIDEYIITIIPTILGDGLKLFEANETEHKLKLIETKTYNGIVDLTYKCR